MTFHNPLLLAGVATAVLPIVLHLLARSRARPVEWGANLLLSSQSEGGSSAGRLRDVLLLLARSLAVVVLALVLARPSTSGASAADPNTAVVLVIDASPSMLHPEGNTTRFELARRAALDRLGRLKQGDQAGLVVLGALPNADMAVTPDLQAVASQVASMTTSIMPADLADGQRRAREMLNDAGVEGGEILLLADRQRATWEPLRQTATEVGPGPRVIAHPVGSTTNQNAWIESIELLNPPAIAGVPVRVAVKIRNDADQPNGNLGLRLALGDQSSVDQPVAVTARSETRAVRTLTPTTEGPATITATIDQSGSPADDTFREAIDVVPPPQIGWLSVGATTQSAATRPTTQPAWLNGRGRFVATAIAEDSDLSQQQVIVLSDELPGGIPIKKLEQYAAAGGCLILAPGPNVTPASWNGRLWKSGFGLAPAVAGDRVPSSPIRPTDVPDFAQPDIDQANWPAVGVRRYWQLSPGGAETVVCSIGPAPLVTERAFGRGRVMTVAVPLDGRWAASPSAGIYDGLIEALVRHATARQVDRNVDIGVPFEQTLSLPRDRNVFVLRPDGRFDRANLNNVGGQLLFRYTRTDLPGRYVVRIADLPLTEWYVRPDPSESDLRLQDDAALNGLLQSAGIARDQPHPDERDETDWGTILLAGMAVLLAMDLTLANGFLPRRRTE